jgi:GNAT superfamily N-acetyltransferase
LDDEIREITDTPLETSADIIRKAFGTVTGELGITEENCPRFPAYNTIADLNEKRDRGSRFFGAFTDGRQVGIILVEMEEDGRYFAKRLAVLPEYWHRGIGEKLMARAIECIRDFGVGKINIAIVNEQTVLKDWYLGMGFREVAVEVIDFLPFNVGFLEKEIS